MHICIGDGKGDGDMKFIIVNDDIDVIRPYWNDFIDYLVIKQNLIVKLGHLFLQKHSPFYNENINNDDDNKSNSHTIRAMGMADFREDFDFSWSSSSSSRAVSTSRWGDVTQVNVAPRALKDSDKKKHNENLNSKDIDVDNSDIGNNNYNIIYLPLSVNYSQLKNANFSAVVCIISALIIRCITMAQVKNKKLAKRYDKISIDKNDMQWILLRYLSSSSPWPWFYWTMMDLSSRNGGNTIIKCNYVNKMICYLCKHDKIFSGEIIQLLLWIFHNNIKSESNLKLMKHLLNIDDKIQMHRFKMLFDCQSNDSNVALDMKLESKKLYCLMGKSLDLFSLINNLGKQTRKCLPLIECLIDIMKENDNFRKFINQFRSRKNSRWGKNLDQMVKHLNFTLYDEMQNARPMIIKWKV